MFYDDAMIVAYNRVLYITVQYFVFIAAIRLPRLNRAIARVLLVTIYQGDKI